MTGFHYLPYNKIKGGDDEMKKQEATTQKPTLNTERTEREKELIRKASAYYMQKNEEVYRRLANR